MADNDMGSGITVMIGKDGVAREYDDTYDIVIHCETKEEKSRAIKRISESIPCDFINAIIAAPENAGTKSSVLSWLKRKWEEEQNDSD